jgi:tellurite resistance protein TerC
MQSIGSPFMWSLFAGFTLVALLIDFFAMSKQGAHRVSTRESAIWSLVWVGVSLAFMGWLWWHLGGAGTDEAARSLANAKSLEFLTGYLIEKALAVDNIFVFLMLFTYFAVPAEYQKRALMIGILLALVMRAVMILVGAWLITQFHWVLYLFGAFLLFTGIKMWWAAGQEPDLDNNPHRGGRRQDGYTAAGGDRAHRHRRSRVRSRLDTGHLRDHDRPFHRAHLQRVRDPRPACDVLPAGQYA